MRRFTTRPTRLTATLAVLAVVFVVVIAIVALLRHQRRVETIDDIVREEQATIPYDRSAGVDDRGNTRVASEPWRNWRPSASPLSRQA